MARDVHLEMPVDLPATSPEFITVLNDRLRRQSDAIRDLQKQIDRLALAKADK